MKSDFKNGRPGLVCNPAATGPGDREAAVLGWLPPDALPAVRKPEEPIPRVLARCELPEGKPLPLSWTYHNPMQLPLLPPAELAVYRRCLAVFGGECPKARESQPGLDPRNQRVA